MPVYVPDNFDIGVAAPIDSRTVKATVTARDAIPAGVRFDGLAVYVVQDNITYQLQGGTTNSDWIGIAGSTTGTEYLSNLIDVSISSLQQSDQLLYNNTTGNWFNTPPAFVFDSIGGNIISNISATEVIISSPVKNVSDGYSVTGGERQTYLNTDDNGTFSIYSKDVISNEIYPLLSQTDGGIVTVAGVTMELENPGTWAMDVNPDPLQEGIRVNVEGWLQRGLQINSASDGNIMNVAYQGSNWNTVNLNLGTTPGNHHGDDDRDFVATFDNFTFSIGSNGLTGFRVSDSSNTQLFQMPYNSKSTFTSEQGINQSATDFTGYINVTSNAGASLGPIGTGYITAEDYVKTNTYFEGDSVFNHRTLVLPDSTGPNYSKIAEVVVEGNEYVTIELDYVIPNSTIGVNKGRVIMQTGYDPDGETTQTTDLEITETVYTGYDVGVSNSSGEFGVLNTNGGISPPFNTGDEIRIPDYVSDQLITVEFLPGSTGTYYMYRALGHAVPEFAGLGGYSIFKDVTTTQEVTTVITGDSFISSLIDVKDKATGETGVLWKAVFDDVGPAKTMSLYAQLSIDETFLSYIAKYQQNGTPSVTFYDDQPWIATLPAGSGELTALTTVGSSYWTITGNNLYNVNTGDVSVGKTTANFKLDVDGTIGLTDSINYLSGTKIESVTAGSKYLEITNPGNSQSLFSISDVGNIFINKTDTSSTEAKLNISSDENSTYGLKVQSYDSNSSSARFSGGLSSTTVPVIEITDYFGQYSASITGNGIIDADKELRVSGGSIMSCNNAHFTYQGDNVWTDGQAGSIGDLSDVDLTGISVNNILKWNGANWVVTPSTSGVTNLDYTPSPTNGLITSDTGDDATVPVANALNAGLMSASNWTKLDGISSGAEVNVQADWLQANSSSDEFIKNKPTLLSDFSDDINAVSHISDTSIHVTQSDKDSWNIAEENVQADWAESNSALDSYILNKPALTSAATTDVDTVVSEFSANLITSGAVFTAVDGLDIDPSTGFIRFSDDTIRLVQGSTTIDVGDVPKLDTDGKVLASQTRTLAGGATQVFPSTAALESSIQGGTDIPVGDFIYITGSGDTHNGMWIAAVLLTGATWDMATAVSTFDVLDVTTGADYYTQTEINNSFSNNSITAGDGLTGGGSLTYAGSELTLTVATGNGLKLNSSTKVVEIDSIVGTPTGTVFTP